MRTSKICIQLVLSISLILLFLNTSVYSQQEDQVREEDRNKTCTQTQVQSELSAQKNAVALKVLEAASLVEEKGEETFPDFQKKDSEWFYDDFHVFVWKLNRTGG